MTAPQTNSASYEVGYGKPPRRTQFKKGQSGNPGGRPRQPAERLKALALQEAYRAIIVMEDGRAAPVSAIQAVLRSQIESATSGNVRAQCAILAMIRDIELSNAIEARLATLHGPVNDDDVDDDSADYETDEADGDDPALRADEIDTDGERQQEEREQAAAPPPSADGAPQPENAAAPPPWSPPAAAARVRGGAVVRDPTPKRRVRRERGRSACTAAARRAARDPAASAGLEAGRTPALRPPVT